MLRIRTTYSLEVSYLVAAAFLDWVAGCRRTATRILGKSVAFILLSFSCHSGQSTSNQISPVRTSFATSSRVSSVAAAVTCIRVRASSKVQPA